MRGGFVACLAASAPSSARLESAVRQLRWHTGVASFHRHGGLQVACLVDESHGPLVEIGSGRLLLCHGAPPEPLGSLEGRDRFVGIESDGVCLRAIRDRMGEVPLFYRRVGSEFWLATEIHPLLTVGPAEPDLGWLSAFTAFVEPPDKTGWIGVKRALPGEVLQVEGDLRVSSRRYFSPAVGKRRGSTPFAGAAENVRELFFAAVAKRTSRSCGILLSGGLDSSAVAVVAARTTRPALLTTTHPGVPQVDELVYARAVADAVGIPLTTLEVEPDPWDPADDLRTFGVPPLAVPTGMYGRGLAALAALGCEVALDGHDGDGVFGRLYAWAANTLLDLRLEPLVRAAHDHGSTFVLRTLVKDVVPPAVLGRLRRSKASSCPQPFQYFRGETARRQAEASRWRAPRRGWEEMQLEALLPPTTQSFEELELIGARSAIDLQHPFADPELLDLVIRLPHAVKTSGVLLKPLLRDALEDLLPPIVAGRNDKTVFGPVIEARVDLEACYRWVRDSSVKLPDLDYERLLQDTTLPGANLIFWTRLASAHVFLAGVRA